MSTFTLVVIFIAGALLFSALKILKEYERGVMFTLGRFTGVKGPGVIIVVPFIQQMTRSPIWVDPSHAAGASPYVAPLARAAIAAGAQAVIVECHPDPARACSDALQALDFPAMAALAADLRRLAPAPEKAGAL